MASQPDPISLLVGLDCKFADCLSCVRHWTRYQDHLWAMGDGAACYLLVHFNPIFICFPVLMQFCNTVISTMHNAICHTALWHSLINLHFDGQFFAPLLQNSASIRQYKYTVRDRISNISKPHPTFRQGKVWFVVKAKLLPCTAFQIACRGTQWKYIHFSPNTLEWHFKVLFLGRNCDVEIVAAEEIAKPPSSPAH